MPRPSTMPFPWNLLLIRYKTVANICDFLGVTQGNLFQWTHGLRRPHRKMRVFLNRWMLGVSHRPYLDTPTMPIPEYQALIAQAKKPNADIYSLLGLVRKGHLPYWQRAQERRERFERGRTAQLALRAKNDALAPAKPKL
jgi:hypothetical protein